MYALNATCGALIWAYHTNGPVESGLVLKRGLSVEDDEIFFGSDDGCVCVLSLPHHFTTALFHALICCFRYAIYAANGTLIWKFCTGASVTASPLLGPDMLYVGSTDNNMYAIQTSKQFAGALRWKVNTTAPIAAAAAFSLDMSALYFQSDVLYAVRVEDGRLLWSMFYSAISPRMPPLVGSDSTIYAAYGNPSFLEVAAVYGAGENAGKVKFVISVNSGGMALDADGALYVNDLSLNSLQAYYTYGPYAGQIDWSLHVGPATLTSSTLVDSTLILGTWSNSLYGVCTQGLGAGQVKWSLQLPPGASSHLFSAGVASADRSRFFVGSLDYSVYCIKLA